MREQKDFSQVCIHVSNAVQWWLSLQHEIKTAVLQVEDVPPTDSQQIAKQISEHAKFQSRHL